MPSDENVVRLEAVQLERELKEREARIEQAEKDSYLVRGTELKEIRDRNLYMEGSNRTWEMYCRDRWHMNRQHANRLIDAASFAVRLKNTENSGEMYPIGYIPVRETQIRPLLILPEDDQIKVWFDILKLADGNPRNVTAEQVEEAVARYAPNTRTRTRATPGRVSKKPRVNYDEDIWEPLKAIAEQRGRSLADFIGDVLQLLAFGEPIDPALLPKTSQDKINAAIRQERKRMEVEYAAKLQREIEEHIKRLKTESLPRWERDAKQARINSDYYETLINNHKPIFTTEQYTAILRCLHPDSRDSISIERLQSAFQLFNAKKPQLTDKPT